ncbi:hypothetical protein BS17DRAFT_766684 [Gyrodon lividus]|nr:hypothetical protein BS17DRAFT_766684 [Gyrodon lividus]
MYPPEFSPYCQSGIPGAPDRFLGWSFLRNSIPPRNFEGSTETVPVSPDQPYYFEDLYYVRIIFALTEAGNGIDRLREDGHFLRCLDMTRSPISSSAWECNGAWKTQPDLYLLALAPTDTVMHNLQIEIGRGVTQRGFIVLTEESLHNLQAIRKLLLLIVRDPQDEKDKELIEPLVSTVSVILEMLGLR